MTKFPNIGLRPTLGNFFILSEYVTAGPFSVIVQSSPHLLIIFVVQINIHYMNDSVSGLQARVSTQANPIKQIASSVLKSVLTHVMQTLNVNKVVFATIVTQ